MLAVTTYQAFLLVHIVAAVVWLGGGLTLSILGTRLAKQRDPARMAGFARDAEWVGNRIFVPSGLLVLLFGFLMIHEGPWGYGELWIQLALGLFAATFLTGALYLGPQSGKVAKLIAEHEEAAPQVQDQIRRVLFVSRLDLLTLYSILVVMVAKPTAGDALLFAIWAVVLALAALAVVVDHRREPSATPSPSPAE